MTLRPEPYLHLQDDRVFDALEAFEAQAAERGTTPATLAFAWLLAHPHVTAVVVGPRRPGAAPSRARCARARSVAAGARAADGALRMTVLVLSEHDVRALLPMDECIEAMDEVLRSLARGELHQPLRFVTRPPDAESLMGFMPAHRGGAELGLVAEGDRDRARRTRRAGSTRTRARCSCTTARRVSCARS